MAPNGYRRYGEAAATRLQQIMFFRELGFSLDEIRDIVERPDFDVLEALQSHRNLLKQRAGRLKDLLNTVDKTIESLKRGTTMNIKDYYQGFSDKEIEQMRAEVKERWGRGTLEESETRVGKLNKEEWARVQSEGDAIWKTAAANMAKGPESPAVQEQIEKWRKWLEHFYTYTDEMLLGLGRAYSQDPRFAKHFLNYGEGFPEFLTKAIEYFIEQRKNKKR